jgi:hypothetical protein
MQGKLVKQAFLGAGIQTPDSAIAEITQSFELEKSLARFGSGEPGRFISVP